MLKGFKKRFNVFIVILLIFVLFLFVALITFYFLQPSEVKLDIATRDEICVDGSFLFPSVFYDVAIDSKHIKAIFRRVKKVGDVEIYAKSLCFKSNFLLKDSVVYKGFLKSFIRQTNLELKSVKYPSLIDGNKQIEDKVNVSEVLKFNLTVKENYLTYFIRGNETSAICGQVGSLLYCPLELLDLKQGEKYELKLLSIYDKHVVNNLFTKTVSILNPVTLVTTSVKEGSILLDHSPNIELEFSKEINELDNIKIEKLEKNEYLEVDFDNYGVEYSYDGNKVSIDISQSLQASKSYRLVIDSIIAKDGSFLESPYILNFKTSNGPNIYSSNLKSYAYPIRQSLVLKWDETPAKGEDIKSKISIAPNFVYTVSTYGNKTTINPTGSLNRCTTYKVALKPGIKSINGVVGTQGFTKSFKTSCATIYTVGISTKGRKFYAYHFGSGTRKIIYYGSMHGNESNTRTLLYNWISELELNSKKIPDDITVIVIPTINPDGILSHTRFNANGVDLNRNFATTDWQEQTYFAGGTYPHGGGLTPLSEVESKALANYVLRYRPYLTLSYHSAASVVIVNENILSIPYGKKYASLSKYRYVPPADDGVFEYSITGSFGRWAAENGLSALIIELSSGYSHETSRNLPAMWKMLE